MSVSESLEATLLRLKEERDLADRRYNEALTGVDRTLGPPIHLPAPVPAFDDHQVGALNDAWNILPSEPQLGGGVKGRLAGFVWRLVGPYLQRQLTFNSRLVDHVNRNANAARESHRASEAMVVALRDQLAAHAQFQSRLMVYLQQVTAYVDTKDRDTAGGALVLNAAISGLAEEMAKRTESLTAREQRYESRTAAIAGTSEELRAMVGVSQHALMSLRREVERLIGRAGLVDPADRRADLEDPPDRKAGLVDSDDRRAGVLGPPSDPGPPTNPAPPRDAFAPALDAYKYVGFEDQFRGSRDVIRERLESYLPLFEGQSDVLDIGCGRGEFLDLLAARGISARGIDLNHEMAEACQARGLEVTEADAVGYLTSLPDASLGGIFAAQVVEHLEPGYLLQLLDLSYHKLRPGGRLVLETLNPACWVAFFESYIRDITHRWPLHPETLKYLVIASGFTHATIEFRSPVPDQDKLQPIAAPAGADSALVDLIEAFNGNVEKLNSRMFTFMDYAVVGEKGASA
jgi:SAM-dependent methyltransferase